MCSGVASVRSLANGGQHHYAKKQDIHTLIVSIMSSGIGKLGNPSGAKLRKRQLATTVGHITDAAQISIPGALPTSASIVRF